VRQPLRRFAQVIVIVIVSVEKILLDLFLFARFIACGNELKVLRVANSLTSLRAFLILNSDFCILEKN
jgi:hypothetical protein